VQVTNADIASVFDEVSDLLEINGEGFFRVRAYRNASRVIRDLSTPLSVTAKQPGALEKLPGIGKDLASRIMELLETGDLGLRADLEEKLPRGVLELMKVPGLGPRKAHALYLELGVCDLQSLEKAAREGKVKTVKGFGPKSEASILSGIETVSGFGKRVLWAWAEQQVNKVLDHMADTPGLQRIEVAGSYRRLMETVGDVDFVVIGDEPAKLLERFQEVPGVERVIASGATKVSQVIYPGLQVDMRAVEPGAFGAAMQYFTGSQAHNVALRGIAIRKGMKLNEYGLFREEEAVAGGTEEGVYEALGMPWIPPELRENRGEIGAAFEGELPDLLEVGDIHGDLHIHTDATDGRNTLEEMVAGAKDRRYSYIAITNHTRRVTMAGGLDEEGLMADWSRVEAISPKKDGMKVLKGVEVDILDDGSLDIADEVLAGADLVIASVHYSMNMARSRMTRRLVRAMENPLVHMIGHPSGRKINKRAAYQVDMEELLAAAARTGTWLELNASPDRLDIDDRTCREAKKHGVLVSIATDAHSIRGLDFMTYGVNQARRGWLEKADVLNTRGYRDLHVLLHQKRDRMSHRH
jgi:DNA polymerase (family X)